MFTPRYRKEARQLLHSAWKFFRYRKDLLDEPQKRQLIEKIEALEQALKTRDKPEIENAATELDRACAKLAPSHTPAQAWLRENFEVILVALIIALGIRTYYLQPFKIPTGSMQPTLNGVIGVATDEPAPNLLARSFQFLTRGRNYESVISRSSGNQVLHMREQQRLHFFTFTRLIMSDGTYTIYAPAKVLFQDFGVRPGRTYSRGEPIVHGYIESGDMLFVNKVSYHFTRPERGEVFVFRTTGIRAIEAHLDPAMGSQYYIKRIGGVPGDRLRIDAPALYVNGELPEEKGLRRVIAAEDGYRGYSNRSASQFGIPPRFRHLSSPRETVQVPENAYFALGDNSYASSDSRIWGFVPEENVVGRAFFVFWPFAQHWGLID